MVTMPTTPNAATKVTRTLRSAGFDLFHSQSTPTGSVRVKQRYAVSGALTPADTRGRRERRALLAADVLRAHGYTVIVVGDEIVVRSSRQEER